MDQKFKIDEVTDLDNTVLFTFVYRGKCFGWNFLLQHHKWPLDSFEKQGCAVENSDVA